jgi:hypothetical protein
LAIRQRKAIFCLEFRSDFFETGKQYGPIRKHWQLVPSEELRGRKEPVFIKHHFIRKNINQLNCGK